MTGNTIPSGFPALYECTPNPFALSRQIGDPGLAFLAIGISGLLSVGLLLARFRASSGLERQQYKWVVLAMALIVATFIADFVARASGSQAFLITSPLQSLAIMLMPVSMGIAILRHRLFDIDRVINRVIVYAVLSVGIISTYALAVIVLQAVLDPLTQGSDLAVAGTTLLVAVLFRPLHAGVQRIVDRRFNRVRYDATKTVEAFSIRLRDEVDLDTIGRELQSVVSQTVQPAHVSLWIRHHQRR